MIVRKDGGALGGGAGRWGGSWWQSLSGVGPPSLVDATPRAGG